MNDTEVEITAGIDPAAPSRKTRNGHKKLDLVRLLGSLDRNPDSVDQISEWCHYHVTKWHWQGHRREDGQDIVQEALADFLACRHSHPDFSVDELAGVLIRALDRHKKRIQRAQQLPIVSIDPHYFQLSSGPTHEEEVIDEEKRLGTRRSVQRLCEILFEALEGELARLSDRDQDLLARHYGLEAFFPPRDSQPPLKKSARRKALYRARVRLAKRLTAFLSSRLENAGPRQRRILEIALAVVAQESYLQVVRYLEAC